MKCFGRWSSMEESPCVSMGAIQLLPSLLFLFLLLLRQVKGRRHCVRAISAGQWHCVALLLSMLSFQDNDAMHDGVVQQL